MFGHRAFVELGLGFFGKMYLNLNSTIIKKSKKELQNLINEDGKLVWKGFRKVDGEARV
jgi:hypothetical protein